MLDINFIENISDEEISKLTKIFKILSREIHWQIIRELLKSPNLTQAELKERISNSNISENIKSLIEMGIVTKKAIKTNQKNKRANYFYRLKEHTFTKEFMNESIETGIKYRKYFNMN